MSVALATWWRAADQHLDGIIATAPSRAVEGHGLTNDADAVSTSACVKMLSAFCQILVDRCHVCWPITRSRL
jgi:hypothetical protein